MAQGILYIVYDSGAKISYVDNLKRSILSLRKNCDLPVTIYTDRMPISDFDEKLYNVKVVKIKGLNKLIPAEAREDRLGRGHTFLKLYAFKDLPYDSTIFADVDTIFLDDPSKLISKEHDLSICRDIKYSLDAKQPLAKRFNTGFFVAKKGKAFSALIEKAIEMREEGKGDQFAINKAMDFMFDINVRILPQSWNVRGKIKELVDSPSLLHWHGVETYAAKKFGEVVELVYTADLKSAAGTRLAGSNPAFATNKKNAIFPETKIETNVDDI